MPGRSPRRDRSFLELPGSRESEAVNALQRIARIAGDPAQPLVVALGEQALGALDSHLARLHGELQRCDGVEAAWLGKGRGTVVRLRLRWHCSTGRRTPRPSCPAPRHHGRTAARPAASGTISVSTRVVLARAFRRTASA